MYSVLLLAAAACTYDVNVTGIPKSIALDIPQLGALPTTPAKDAGHDAADAADAADAGDGDQ